VLDDPRVGIVAPKMYLPDECSTLERSQRRDPSLLRTWGTALLGGPISRRFASLSEAVADPARYERSCDVDWAVGAALLISRACLDAVGQWDESFFLYSEETDFCRRARRAGFRVRFTPDAVVRHEGGDGWINPRLRAMMTVNKVREYRRRHRPPASWCFFAGNLFHELTRGFAGRRASRSAAIALVRPKQRPAELDSATSLMPR
jgi:N-acetylglucosaminyl-diphospho-decaprenol L-rhamnosyltransferase